MKQIKILYVSFKDEIKAYEIPAFRGAIAAKTGTDNLLFHNHLGNNKLNYSYPLIQYKRLNKKPTIVCVDQGVDEIHKFFENRNWGVKLSGRELDMKIDKLYMNEFKMQVWDKDFRYTIRNWIALNQENYRKYEETESLTERIAFLERILTGNLLAFAKGIEWTVDKQIRVRILEILGSRPVKLKSQRLMGFDIEFKSNVFIPNQIGLGKSVSLGYGVVRESKNRTK